MKSTFKLAALAAALVCAGAAQAQAEGPWMVRVRAVNLGMQHDSEAGSGALTPALLPADAVRVSDKTIPEVDISYFFTKNVAAELILTVPQRHDVNITSGPLAEKIGSMKHLPPTLTLQYHFMPDGAFRPYVGAGVNFTKFMGVNLHSSVAGADLALDSNSFGLALQAGFDVKVGKNVYLNFDVKKIQIRSDVLVGGSKVSRVSVDPLAIGVGLGWRF